jgi:hypothetical protein
MRCPDHPDLCHVTLIFFLNCTQSMQIKDEVLPAGTGFQKMVRINQNATGLKEL